MLNIVTWKYDNGIHPKKGIKFTDDHVNILYSMICRNVKIPFKFHCIGENFSTLNSDIIKHQIWKDFRELGGCYTRLRIFSKEMKHVIGKYILSLDLDTVIVDDITNLVNINIDFKALCATDKKNNYCGTMFFQRAGSRDFLYRKFDSKHHPEVIRKRGFTGTDQAFISYMLGNKEEVFNLEENGIYNFRMLYKEGRYSLPDNARMVFFNGGFDPSMLKIQKKFPWVKKYWKENT